MQQATESERHLPDSVQLLERPEDFLSPEQRIHAIAEILCTMALRALKEQHESPQAGDI